MKAVTQITSIIALVFLLTAVGVFLYREYGDDIRAMVAVEMPVTVYVGDIPYSVYIADEKQEWHSGLSRFESLPALHGMLFIFTESGYPRIWMRDMRFAIDIIFIDTSLEIIDIKHNITPDTYPESFSPSQPARFVLEVNAHEAEELGIEVGQELQIPLRILPPDIRKGLREIE